MSFLNVVEIGNLAQSFVCPTKSAGNIEGNDIGG